MPRPASSTVAAVFAADEREKWRHRGNVWCREPWKGTSRRVRLLVRPSLITGAGMGLFWDDDCDGWEGQRLGCFSGRVVHTSDSRDDAECWALEQADDRLVILRMGGAGGAGGAGGSWAIVDARGSVFEFVNHANDRECANLHVTSTGIVELQADVSKFDELTWWYGISFTFATASNARL